MHILGIIILYNPDVENVLENISKFIDSIDHLIIWKNSQCDGLESVVEKYSGKVSVLGDNINKGIAHPLNIVSDKIQHSDLFTHLLTMDQDSEWQNFDFFIHSIHLRNDNSIYSPNINNEDDGDQDFKKVSSCITSGALFSRESLRKIKCFNETYSVDCVDYDFSFKANENGIEIYKVRDARMLQSYGAPKVSRFFGIKSNVYSADRSYFIVRNHILLWKDYPRHLSLRFRVSILKHYIFARIIKIILMEDQKTKKIISILKGLFDGITNNRKKNYT